MTKRTGLVGTTVLAIILAAFTGSALAGNGHGNGAGQGNGNGNSQAAPATQPASPAPGNSANAPGKDKTSSASTTSSGGGKASTSPGHAKKSGSGGATAKGGGSASQNSPSIAGVKPTNATAHNTHTTVGASPNVSKRYGNGQTAAGIAKSRGAPDSTPMYGPGNSQPHKVQKCPGSGHWVDVHAVKSYSAASCTASSKASESVTVQHSCGVNTVTTTKTRTQKGHAYGRLKHGKALHTTTKTETKTTPTGEVCSSSSSTTTFQTVVTQQAAQASQTAQTAQSAQSHAAVATVSSSQPAGGVLGATATVKSGKPAGGVAGALAAVGNVAGETLPFTGFALWIAMLVALGLIALGLVLRHRGRATI